VDGWVGGWVGGCAGGVALGSKGQVQCKSHTHRGRAVHQPPLLDGLGRLNVCDLDTLLFPVECEVFRGLLPAHCESQQSVVSFQLPLFGLHAPGAPPSRPQQPSRTLPFFFQRRQAFAGELPNTVNRKNGTSTAACRGG